MNNQVASVHEGNMGKKLEGERKSELCDYYRGRHMDRNIALVIEN